MSTTTSPTTSSKTAPPDVQPVSSSRRPLVISAVIGAVVIVGIVVWLIVHSMAPAEPRLNEPTPVLAKFVATSTFDAMPYEKQRLYYKMLDDRGKEIEQAKKDQKLTDAEYRSALDAAWLGKHINRVEKFVSLPTSNARNEYVAQLVTKKLKKDAEHDKKKKLDAEDQINADEAAAELKVESWPPSVREQWKTFHDAYRSQKKAREEATSKPAGK